jgi:micrococcal nuclease
MGLFDLFKKKVKGNISRDGKKIYYTPEHRLYESVQAEQTFKTPEDARAAGYRAPEK